MNKEKIIDNMRKAHVEFADPDISWDRLYGEDPAMDALCDSINVEDRLKAVEAEYGLDKLKDDTSDAVRLAIARKGYIFNSFIKDSSPMVRLEVAKQQPQRVQDDANSVVRSEALKRLS